MTENLIFRQHKDVGNNKDLGRFSVVHQAFQVADLLSEPENVLKCWEMERIKAWEGSCVLCWIKAHMWLLAVSG